LHASKTNTLHHLCHHPGDQPYPYRIAHDKSIVFLDNHHNYLKVNISDLIGERFVSDTGNVSLLGIVIDGDGVFAAYGVKYGLYKSTDTRRANDINGARNIELTSLAGQEEKYSNYTLLDTDYATTKALLETLVSTPGT